MPEYIGHEVDLRISSSCLTVYYQGPKLCTHALLNDRDGAYSTNPEHMPKGSNAREPWNKERFIKWANRIGINTTTKHLSRVRFRDIKGILKNNHDLDDEWSDQPSSPPSSGTSPYLRGSKYYGGKKNG